MRALDNLPMKGKLALAFGLLLTAMVGLGVVALHRLAGVNQSAAEIRENWLPSVRHLGQMSETAMRYRQRGALHLLVEGVEAKRLEEQAMAGIRADVEGSWRAYEPFITSGEERRMADAVEAAWQAYLAIDERFRAISRTGDRGAGIALQTGEMRVTYQRLRESLNQLTDHNVRGGSASAEAGSAAYEAARALLLGGLGLAVLLAGVLGWLLIRTVSGPMVATAGLMGRVAAGDLDLAVPGQRRRDELGAMARALEGLRVTALRARTLEAEALAAREAGEAARLEAQRGLADRVERQLGAVVTALSGSVASLESGIGRLAMTADSTQAQAASVASGAAEATGNVQTVAAAAEELSASVGEITRQVTQAATTARRAADDVRTADAEVAGLSEAAARIGDVVRLIGGIAGQTNLLALNATIEAARAGEAGKGFAVVASEVKALASQTAKATEEIGAQVAAIQAATARAVGCIKGIAEVVGEVDHIAATIAAAVEEQGAATREIARNVAEAAQGTNDVSASIAHVGVGVEETTGALRDLRDTTASVARQGEDLREELDGLLRGLRAA